MNKDLHLSALKRGYTILARRGELQQPGKVLLITSGKLGLQFPVDISANVQEGDRMEVHFWGEAETGNTWEAEVLRVVGHGKQAELQIVSWKEVTRSHVRISRAIPFSGTVEHSTHKELTGKQLMAETKNLSSGGLLFETQLPLELGDRLKIGLALGDSTNFQLRGIVVRRSTKREKQRMGSRVSSAVYAVAIQFSGLDEAEEERIDELLLGHPKP